MPIPVHARGKWVKYFHLWTANHASGKCLSRWL